MKIINRGGRDFPSKNAARVRFPWRLSCGGCSARCVRGKRGKDPEQSLASFPLSVHCTEAFAHSSQLMELGIADFLPSRCAHHLPRGCPALPVPALPPGTSWLTAGTCSLSLQAAEMDGFQADTEEDEEDDDCMIVDVQPGKGGKGDGHQGSSSCVS